MALELLSFGADSIKGDQVNNDGETALTLVCSADMEPVALKLLECGADVCHANHVNKDGNTALILACVKQLKPVALKLLSYMYWG